MQKSLIYGQDCLGSRPRAPFSSEAMDEDAGKDSTRQKLCSFESCSEGARVRDSESRYEALQVKREGVAWFALHSAGVFFLAAAASGTMLVKVTERPLL